MRSFSLAIQLLAMALASPVGWCAQEKPVRVQARTPAPGHWPQWRGPNRDNVSTETGLLKEWPEGGPKLLWKAEGLGEGVGGVSVAGGLVFLMGYREDKEFLTSLDGAGNVVWSVPVGPAVREDSAMRWLSQRTPTIDDDRVYAFTARGALLCLRSADGGLLWKKDYATDFGGKLAQWQGFCDFPLVDGERLICTPGGAKATIVALNKKTGEALWTCGIAECRAGTHSSVIACDLGGVHQYVHQLDCGTLGVSAKDGHRLWFYEGTKAGMGNVHTAILWKQNSLFTLCGWNSIHAMLEFPSDKDGKSFAVKYKAERNIIVDRLDGPDFGRRGFTFHGWYGGTLRVGNYLYSISQPGCMDLETGKVLWNERIGGVIGTFADGLFYTRSGSSIGLYEAGPEKIRKCSEFGVGGSSMTFPVLAGGRLYLRAGGDLYCYTVRGADYTEPPRVWEIPFKPPTKKTVAGTPENTVPLDLKPPPGEPDAIFVPTPQDVVEKMLELAKVTKDDVVYDLGSGDGRIVLAAARNKGCKSVGFEINPGLVWESRMKAKHEKLDSLVTFEEKDLFAADLSQATVVTLYLGQKNNERLLPQLQKLKAGARVVSHAHLLGEKGPKWDNGIRMSSKEDGMEHVIYVWTLPFKANPEGK